MKKKIRRVFTFSIKRHIRKFQVAVMQLGVYLETFLQAVMSVSHVVQLKFHVAVVQLGVHFGASSCLSCQGRRREEL